MTFNGTRVTRVQRFAFGVDEASPFKVFGEWSFVIGSASSPVYYGDRIGFAKTFISNEGHLMASGSRTGAASNLAIARQALDGSWYILLDTSPSKAQLSSVETYNQDDLQTTERARQVLQQMLR